MNKKSVFLELCLSRLEWRLLIVFCSLLTATFGLIGPFLQKEFIDRLTLHTSPWSVYFFGNFPILGFIVLAFVCILFSQFFSQLTTWLGARESFIMQRVFAQKIYDKTLSLRIDTISKRPIGEIVQLYATDVPGSTVFLDQTLPSGASTIFPLILAPFAISYLFEIKVLPIISVMLFIIFLNSLMAFRQSRFFFNFKQLAGERIGLVSEWIQNIRTIRILGWTHFFEQKIFDKREIETVNRIRMVTNGQLMNSLSSSITFILNVAALLSLVLYTKKTITPGELLVLLWIVGVFLTRPFRQMPWFFTFAFDSWTSLKRLQNFLDIPENDERSASVSETFKYDSSLSDNALEISNLNLNIAGKKILTDISFNIKKNDFIAIVGEVGAGKSMLLLSILGETGATFSEFKVFGLNAQLLAHEALKSNFAYVPQEGFIMSASLRENVAFIYDINPSSDSLIEEALLTAQFNLERERVAQGLDTEIGERGVNLSGGQKQRVSLARVHFEKAPILLLDDCLSAVDIDTEQKILEQLTVGAWSNRTRLLITHRLSVLTRVDQIIFMQDGKILAIGSYKDLINNNRAFNEFVTTVTNEGQHEKA